MILAILTSKYIFVNYGFKMSLLLLLIPLVNAVIWYLLLRELDGIYFGFLLLNGIFYITACVIVIVKNHNQKFNQ